MRLAILMSIGSPWARHMALELSALRQSVHVIDFADTVSVDSYLSASDRCQSQSIHEMHDCVAAVHVLDSRFESRLRFLTSSRQVKRICREFGADVLLSLYGGGWATMAYLSGIRPYAVYVVGTDVLRPGRVGSRIRRLTLGSAEVVFANGDYLAQRTRSLVPRASVCPLLIGVDTGVFAPRPPAAGPIRIVCTRGFLPVYNNEYLVEGLARLPQVDTELEAVFTSAGSTLEMVRSLADRLLPGPLREKVQFLGGVTSGEILSTLQGGHVFVSLSRSDGTATSLLEAMSCGVFPVLSDIPQNREWVDPALENGILVPLDEPEALAAALKRAICDAPLRRRAAEINRRLVLKRADCRRNMATMVERLEEIVRARRARGGVAC